MSFPFAVRTSTSYSRCLMFFLSRLPEFRLPDRKILGNGPIPRSVTRSSVRCHETSKHALMPPPFSPMRWARKNPHGAGLMGAFGGGGRNRTGVDGFAGRCMTTLPPRQERRPARGGRRPCKRKGRAALDTAGALPRKFWSGKGVSNSRPQPWQGCALPTELFPH